MIDLYEQCLTISKICAKPHGYAIALHGTGMRDLDLVAIPWTEQAGSPAVLILAIYSGIMFQFGQDTVSMPKGDIAMLQDKCDGIINEHSWPSWCIKPHGRAAFTVNIGPNFFVDLSVMPRAIK